MGIAVAGLLVAVAILINGYLERAPRDLILRECLAQRLANWDRDPEGMAEFFFVDDRDEWKIRSRRECYQELQPNN